MRAVADNRIHCLKRGTDIMDTTPVQSRSSALAPTPRGPAVPPNTPLSPPASPAGGLQFSRRVLALPLVATALDTFERARAERSKLALCAALGVGVATLPLRVLAPMMAAVCPLPVRLADRVMCLWLDCVETVAPCIKGPPRKMCRPVRICYRTTSKKIKAIPDLAFIPVHDLLTTSWGKALMSSADRLILSVDGCIDLVLPSPDSEDAYRLVRLVSYLAHLPSQSARAIYEALDQIIYYVDKKYGIVQ